MAFRSKSGKWGASLALCGLLSAGAQAQTYLNATVGGEWAPGVYGRIQIGNAPPPPVLYADPVLIQRPAVVVPREPIYMYVPPGHAKHWAKHCARYNACGQPVYFLQEPPRGRPQGGGRERGERRGEGPEDRHEGRRDHDHDRGHGHDRGHRGDRHRD
ncbi:MAG: hypothetical protein PHI55_16175 [Burkholderiaceae bacterium]|nr:hypothetical protein [Burkholderiaceae bacterium]